MPPLSLSAYTVLVLLYRCERLVELVLSQRHVRWARLRGGVEFGAGHYPYLCAAQVLLLAGSLLEPWLLRRPFVPALGWPMLALALGAQALRWWCIATLRHRWSTRVVVIRGLPLVRGGPYRWMRHPNYLAVVVEGFALPLVHTAWLTAVGFTLVNLVVLGVRIRVEERALRWAVEGITVSSKERDSGHHR